jgi:transposase InsO family protein
LRFRKPLVKSQSWTLETGLPTVVIAPHNYEIRYKEEEVDLSEYRNFAEAYEQIGVFLEEVYLKKRIHSSLGYLTPSEYEMVWNEQQKKECDMR